MLSNLHSFHFANLLQNSSALPWHVYENTHNRQALHAVNPEISPVILPQAPEKPSPPVISTSKPAQKCKSSPAKPRQNRPESIRPEPANSVVTNNYLNPKNTAGTSVWKPGRGIIEKVDKATGEIMHLQDV